MPTSNSYPKAASLLGNVGYTTVACSGTSFGTRPVGEDIFGPFEAGFSSQQDNILYGLGCPTGKGYVDGGLDTATAASIVAKSCVGEGSLRSGLLDSCGGHTPDYHFHEKLSCCAAATGSDGHSGKVGQSTDGRGIYGMNEANGMLANLDACGGHFGPTPDGSYSYHYHIQDKAPFTIGCLGPNPDNTIVTLAQCRSLYSGCSSSPNSYSVQTGSTWPKTSSGTVSYRNWCPCFDATGSNVGTAQLPCEASPAAQGCSNTAGSASST